MDGRQSGQDSASPARNAGERQQGFCGIVSSTMMPIPGPQMSKLPITKEQIERLIVGDLKSFPGCAEALAVVVVPVLAHGATTTWTVSCFNAGRSDGDAYDRALQHIVPHFQRAYDLF